MDLLVVLTLVNLSNEGLAFIDCLNMEQKNHVKLSGLNYIWMILIPILLMLRDYINLLFRDIYCIIVINSLMNCYIEYASVMFWAVCR